MAAFDSRTIGVPLPDGKTTTILNEVASPAGTRVVTFPIDSDSVLISLWVDTVASGTLTLRVFTQTTDGKEVEIISFPVISAPTSFLLLEKAAIAMSVIRVEAVTTDVATFEVRAKGINTGETSVKISGANDWFVSQVNVSTTPVLLFPSDLVDRNGLLIKNFAGGAVLYIAEIAGKATSSIGWPLGPGESLAMDLAAGQEVWGASGSGTLDVRLAQAGG